MTDMRFPSCTGASLKLLVSGCLFAARSLSAIILIAASLTCGLRLVFLWDRRRNDEHAGAWTWQLP